MNTIVPEGNPSAPVMIPAPVGQPVPLGQGLRDNGILMLTKEFNQDNIMPLVVQLLE